MAAWQPRAPGLQLPACPGKEQGCLAAPGPRPTAPGMPWGAPSCCLTLRGHRPPARPSPPAGPMAASPGLPRPRSPGGAGRRRRREGQSGREGWDRAGRWQERDGRRAEGRGERGGSGQGVEEGEAVVRSRPRARAGKRGRGRGQRGAGRARVLSSRREGERESGEEWQEGGQRAGPPQAWGWSGTEGQRERRGSRRAE